LAAAKKSEYARLIDAAVEAGKKQGSDLESQVEASMDRLVRTMEACVSISI